MSRRDSKQVFDAPCQYDVDPSEGILHVMLAYDLRLAGCSMKAGNAGASKAVAP